MILYEFKLKGIDNIIDVSEIDKKLYLNFNEENGEIENKQEYIVTTSGINMISLRYIKHVDNNRCYSNEINTIYRLYGIEAARKSLISEIDKVFNGDMKLNYHHISILCDVMTNSGELVSIDRHGFGRMDTDPLSKPSFERTVEMFVNSAVYGEVDKLQSVSSRLIMGRAIRCGTGFPEILVDTDILENTEYNDMEMTTMIKNSIDDPNKLNDKLEKKFNLVITKYKIDGMSQEDIDSKYARILDLMTKKNDKQISVITQKCVDIVNAAPGKNGGI
jgi:DNA-directed RNA polymerase II subunit RPB1